MTKRQRKMMTRAVIFTLIWNWMLDGMPSGNADCSCDEDEAFRILERVRPRLKPVHEEAR